MFEKFLNARQKLGYSELSNKRAEQNLWREEFFQWEYGGFFSKKTKRACSSKKQACFKIGDHPFKTRHFWGEGSKINKIYQRERSSGQKLWKFADVLNGWSLGTFHSQSQREKKTPQHKNEVYRISHANPILSSRAPFSSSIQPRIASIFFLCPLFPKLKPPNNQPAVNVNSILNHCQDVVYKFVALLARYGSKSILKFYRLWNIHFNACKFNW